jgi:hypothetical protein
MSIWDDFKNTFSGGSPSYKQGRLKDPGKYRAMTCSQCNKDVEMRATVSNEVFVHLTCGCPQKGEVLYVV